MNATNLGSTTWTPAEAYRLGSQNPQDNLVWGTHRVELAVPSADPGQMAVFNFVVTAPGTAGRYPFDWQMVRDQVHWFGQPSPPLPIAVGSLDGVCPQLHQRHADLATARTDVRAEIAAIDWSDPVSARREAAALARQAHALAAQLALVENQQRTHGCAPLTTT